MARDQICYDVTVTLVFRGEATSPITGALLVAFGDSPVDARRQVDLLLLKEAKERDIELQRMPCDPDDRLAGESEMNQ